MVTPRGYNNKSEKVLLYLPEQQKADTLQIMHPG